MLRDADASEIGAIADLLLASYDEYMPPPDDPLAASFAQYRAEIADVASRWGFTEHVVAEEDGRLAGVVTFIPDGWSEHMHEDRWPQDYAAIRLLGVDPASRGQGIGRKLTEECVARARALGRPWIGLHTTRLMQVARAMYERMGFERFPANDIPISDDFVIYAYRLSLT